MGADIDNKICKFQEKNGASDDPFLVKNKLNKGKSKVYNSIYGAGYLFFVPTIRPQ